jgi:metallo-beta-lactamase class B
MIKKGILTILCILTGLCSLTAQPGNIITINNDIQLIHIQDSIYIHVSWHQSDDYGRFPSNGLIIIKNGQALMIDTPMDNAKTEMLTKYLKDSLSADLAKLIVCHYHDDNLGGLEYIQGIGVESIANSMTVEKCKELGLPIPSTHFTDTLTFDFYGESIECCFFGAGHSFDNITVWMPNKKILFGGCLVKSANSRGLGNLNDAVLADWDTTVKKIMQTYADIEIVVPGHGNLGDIQLLAHTIRLVEAEKKK